MCSFRAELFLDKNLFSGRKNRSVLVFLVAFTFLKKKKRNRISRLKKKRFIRAQSDTKASCLLLLLLILLG